MTLDEAQDYLREHALTEAEWHLYCAMEKVMVEEVREQAGGVMSVGSVVAHFLTDLVCLMMAEQCPGDAGVCAQRTRVIVQFVEGLLVAKVLVADGFREHARRKEEGVC